MPRNFCTAKQTATIPSHSDGAIGECELAVPTFHKYASLLAQLQLRCKSHNGAGDVSFRVIIGTAKYAIYDLARYVVFEIRRLLRTEVCRHLITSVDDLLKDLSQHCLGPNGKRKT